MTTTVVKRIATQDDVFQLEWREQAPCRRSVIIGRRLYSLDFPRVLFLVVKNQGGVFLELRVFFAHEAFGPHITLYWPELPNVHGGSAVCLGDAVTAVTRGLIDPVDAFWNTSFEAKHKGKYWTRGKRVKAWRRGRLDCFATNNLTVESIERAYHTQADYSIQSAARLARSRRRTDRIIFAVMKVIVPGVIGALVIWVLLLLRIGQWI